MRSARFEDLLVACSLHPAMRVYLDNWKSVKNKPNENQGRELLELHTVGRIGRLHGGDGQGLRGAPLWLHGRLGQDLRGEVRHQRPHHRCRPGPRLQPPQHLADGQAATLAYLKYLANHPATARRIATKLAIQFVSDSPSDGLVDTLADVYTSSGTDIRAVLRALSNHPEFLTSSGLKVRTPVADLVATARVLEVDVLAPVSGSSWANAANYIHGGDRVFSWPRPDGPPLTGAAWSAASRVFNSYGMHQNLAGGWWPKEAAKYRTAASWLPAPSLRFDDVRRPPLPHLAGTSLPTPACSRPPPRRSPARSGGRSSPRRPRSTSEHSLAGWLFPRLVSALLDTPDHMTT